MIRGLAAALMIPALFAPSADASRRALLIGVSHYAAGIGPLEGPQYDVESLRNVLATTWGFPQSGITTLVNGAATRDAILAAMDSLASRVQSGDSVFIFFSGHGTSWYAPGHPDAELDPNTGAIVASDGRLIFGRYDIQPRLRKMDERADVFVVFDSCYSGSAVKSVFVGVPKYTDPGAIPRSAPATSFDQRMKQDFGALTVHDQPYPYKNVIYLSAASKAEMAFDIPQDLIPRRYRTVDGRPHGAMTDALIAGLRGAADTNHDSRITYEELYQYVRQRVNRDWNQTPQLLYAEAKSPVLREPLFSAAVTLSPASTSPTASDSVLRVKMDGQDDALAHSVTELPGVTLSSDVFDLSIRPTSGGWDLFHASGTLIQSYAAADRDTLLRRIALEPAVRRLADVQYNRQNFNLVLKIMPEGKGFFRLGERLTPSLTPEKSSYLLLLDIDVSGVVTVLYPRSRNQAQASPANQEVTLDEQKVEAPTGTEFLKAFAFADKPPLFDSLVAENGGVVQFEPTDRLFGRLMDMIKDDLPGRAQTRLKLVTSDQVR